MNIAAWWRDLGFGLFAGAALIGMVFGVEYVLGWVSVTGRRLDRVHRHRGRDVLGVGLGALDSQSSLCSD